MMADEKKQTMHVMALSDGTVW